MGRCTRIQSYMSDGDWLDTSRDLLIGYGEVCMWRNAVDWLTSGEVDSLACDQYMYTMRKWDGSWLGENQRYSSNLKLNMHTVPLQLLILATTYIQPVTVIVIVEAIWLPQEIQYGIYTDGILQRKVSPSLSLGVNTPSLLTERSKLTMRNSRKKHMKYPVWSPCQRARNSRVIPWEASLLPRNFSLLNTYLQQIITVWVREPRETVWCLEKLPYYQRSLNL